jgi:hypothetical protein
MEVDARAEEEPAMATVPTAQQAVAVTGLAAIDVETIRADW